MSANAGTDLYEIHPHKSGCGYDLISDQLPFGRLTYIALTNAVDYAKFYSQSHPVIIRVFDEFGALIETHEAAGDWKEW